VGWSTVMPAAAYARLTSSTGHTLAPGPPRVYKPGKVVYTRAGHPSRMGAEEFHLFAGTAFVRLPAA